MCAILDANVAGQVFGTDRPPAGAAFFRWIHEGRGRLMVGGKLLRELDRNRAFREWRLQAVQAGRILRLNEGVLDANSRRLDASASQASGGREPVRGQPMTEVWTT